MAELIGPKFEEGKPDYTGMGIIDTAVAKAIGTRKQRGTENMDFSNMRPGPMAARSKKEDSFEVKALKNTLAAVSLLDEEDQDSFFSLFNGMLQTNIINPDENLAKIKTAEFIAKKTGYDGTIPVDLDEKTLFKIVADTQDKLPNDIRLKIEGNTDIVGNKELENVNLTAGKLGINFDGETAVGNYNYQNGKLNITPKITKTDDNIKTGTTAQYLFNEKMIPIMGLNNQVKYIPKESITVKFNTDKMIDNDSGSVSYVLRQDDGSEKGTALLSTDANKFETGASYITDGGIKLSGDYKKNYLTKEDETNLGLTFPLTSFADIEASKKFTDEGNDNSLRLNVNKTFDLDQGGTIGLGGYYDQDGNYQAGINYKLAFGEKKKPKRSYNYSTNEPLEALEFVKRNKKKLFNKGGRVSLANGSDDRINLNKRIQDFLKKDQLPHNDQGPKDDSILQALREAIIDQPLEEYDASKDVPINDTLGPIDGKYFQWSGKVNDNGDKIFVEVLGVPLAKGGKVKKASGGRVRMASGGIAQILKL